MKNKNEILTKGAVYKSQTFAGTIEVARAFETTVDVKIIDTQNHAQILTGWSRKEFEDNVINGVYFIPEKDNFQTSVW